MRKTSLVLLSIVVLFTFSSLTLAGESFENCANWRPTSLSLEKVDGTVTATLKFRDVTFEDGKDFLWRKDSFTDYVQSYGTGDILDQLSLYWISDQTGWSYSDSSFRPHDSSYHDQWYRQGDLVVAKLYGIPYSGNLKGQFMLINEKKTDVEMFLNPVHVCKYSEYFVNDCLEPSGHIINGRFKNGEFHQAHQCEE